MSNPFSHVNAKPDDTKRLLGIDYDQLQELIRNAENIHLKRENEKEQSKRRIISKGGGRKPSLSISEQVVLTLTYLRQHPTFQILGVMFDVSESTAHNIFHYWLDILQELLPESIFAQLEDSKDDWEVAQEILEDKELIIDSSEQDRERPADGEEQKKYYSGYKKTFL